MQENIASIQMFSSKMIIQGIYSAQQSSSINYATIDCIILLLQAQSCRAY
jgi:hypothetical protein